MLPDELDTYFQQISHSIKKEGQALLTFFFMNEVQEKLKTMNKNSINFTKIKSSDIYVVKSLLAPSAAIAYDELFITEKLKSYGLIKENIYYGSWSGIKNPLSRQDLIIIRNIGR